MDLRQMRYFVAIAEAGSFHGAADRLHIAQSALSRHMRALEEELGGELFDRGARGVSVNDAGKVLLSRARFILTQLEETRSELLAHNGELRGRVRLMAPSSIAQVLFEPLVNSFLRQHPLVQLELSEGVWPDAISRLREGTIELAVVGGHQFSDYLEFMPLAREQMMLIGPKDDPLMARRFIAPSSLAGLPLLMPGLTRDRLETLLPGSGKLQVSVVVESSAPIRSLAASGWGYAVAPKTSLMGTPIDPRVTGVPIRGFFTERMLATAKGRPHGRAIAELAAAIHAQFDVLLAKGYMVAKSAQRVARKGRVGGR